MDDVGAGGLDLDHLADRHDHIIVDAQKARLARLGGVGVRQAQRVIGEAGIGARIFIGPEPLLADRLDGDVGLGNGALEIEQPEAGHRDHHQDDHRDDGPGDFQKRVVMHLGRGRIGAGAELDDDVDQQRQDEEAHRHDDVEQLGDGNSRSGPSPAEFGGLEAQLDSSSGKAKAEVAAEAHRATAAAAIFVFRQDRGVKDMDSDLANAGGKRSNPPARFRFLAGI